MSLITVSRLIAADVAAHYGKLVQRRQSMTA